jgi:hypothetical protein
MNKAFSFTNRNNEAWFLKMNMFIPSTQSSIKAFYRKVGIDFQSYSIFNAGSRQESWGMKWQQYLWHKQLSLTAQIKKNDFDNPFINQNYSSSSVLKSIQGVFRKRKWPLVTIAYMPTTQLITEPNRNLSQNIFYVLNGTVSQSYRSRKSFMNTTFFYNKFYSRGTDSGFVFFGAESVRLNQDVQAGRFGSHSAIDFYSQPGLSYYTLIQNVDILASQLFSFGFGGKKALVKGGGDYWGGSVKAVLNISKMGSLQIQYEKEFLPDYTRSGLTPTEWGRVVWTKTF